MVPNNLPLTGTSFVGRADLLTEIAARLEVAPVVTLVGPGGAGKTRLAVEFATGALTDYPSGVRLIDFSPVESADRVIAEAAGPLGVAAPAVDLLVEQLADRRVLLLLDNCEHLVEPITAMVRRLIESCPRLRLLCTSREPLGLGAESIVGVGPLGRTADAIALFLDRARAAAPGFEAAAADRKVLADICARLDNLPLAIELAAPWVRVATPAELLPMVSRFDVVPATRRDLPARQRTMRATVQWSHGLLSGDEQTLLRRLAVFRGTFDLAAVTAVCAGSAPPPTAPRPSVPTPALPAPAVAPLAARLAERSMLAVDRGTGTGTRYRLLETIRDLATERLTASGEMGWLRARHFAHFLATAEGIDTQRRRSGSDRQAGRLIPDGDNFRAALGWALEHDPSGALRLATALEPYWMIRSVGEGRRWLQRTLDRAPEPTPIRARALVVPPLVVAGGIPWPQAREMIESAIGIFTLHGDDDGAASARLTLALSAFFHGELVTALRIVDDVRLTSPLTRSRRAVYRAGILSFTPRRLPEGLAGLADALAIAQDVGDTWGAGLALTLLGLAEIRANRVEQAGTHLVAALRSRLQAGVTASAMGGLGELAVAREPRRALVLLDAAVALRERSGVPHFPVPVDAQLAPARAAAARRLAPAVVQRCHEHARTLTTDEAIEFACTPGAASRLTARQQEVALLAANGLTNRTIAEQLHLSVRTVETHVNAALSELGLHSRIQLADWAREADLIR